MSEATARIILTDGTTFEMATALAVRPATLYFKDAKGKECVVEVGAVQQIGYSHDQVLVAEKGTGAPIAIEAAEYNARKHGKAIDRRTVLRGPLEGDIGKLPVHPKR